MSSARLPAWLNGRTYAAGEARLEVEDAGLQLGLAVFETLLLERGWIHFLPEHLERLRAGASKLGIDELPWDPRAALRTYVDRGLAGAPPRLALRLTLTRGSGDGPSMFVTAREIERTPAEGVVLALSSHRKLAGDTLESMKSSSRLRHVLAREEARRAGAWDALIATEEGDLSEGTVCNLFAFTGGRLRTPSLSRGCLSGVVRQKLLEDLGRDPPPWPVEEGRLRPEDLGRADEVFVTNTTAGVLPVVAIIGLAPKLPGAAGPVSIDLRARLLRLEQLGRPGAGPPE